MVEFWDNDWIKKTLERTIAKDVPTLAKVGKTSEAINQYARGLFNQQMPFSNLRPCVKLFPTPDAIELILAQSACHLKWKFRLKWSENPHNCAAKRC